MISPTTTNVLLSLQQADSKPLIEFSKELESLARPAEQNIYQYVDPKKKPNERNAKENTAVIIQMIYGYLNEERKDNIYGLTGKLDCTFKAVQEDTISPITRKAKAIAERTVNGLAFGIATLGIEAYICYLPMIIVPDSAVPIAIVIGAIASVVAIAVFASADYFDPSLAISSDALTENEKKQRTELARKLHVLYTELCTAKIDETFATSIDNLKKEAEKYQAAIDTPQDLSADVKKPANGKKMTKGELRTALLGAKTEILRQETLLAALNDMKAHFESLPKKLEDAKKAPK